MQKSDPEAALQPGDNAGNPRGGQFDLSAHGGEATQINGSDKDPEI